MREWRDRGRSVLFITHRLAEVTAACDRATVLRDGRTVGTLVPQAGEEEKIVELMLGDDADRARPGDRGRGRRPREGAVAASRSSWSATSSSATTPRASSFELRAGEILGVAALEGQGQDELFDYLAGQRKPPSGEMVVSGNAVQAAHPVRGDPRRRGARPGRPRARAAAAAADPREHRRRRSTTASRAGGRSTAATSAGAWRARSSGCRSTRAPSARRAACPAATSRSSRSRAGWRPASRRCCASTRRAASTSAPSARSTRCCASSPRAEPRSCSSPPSCRRSSSSATGRSSCTAGKVTAEMPGAQADEPALLKAAHGLIKVEGAAA